MSSYAAAGVDIDAGEEAVDRIKGAIARTARPGALGGVGGFGGLFDLRYVNDNYTDPVLVSTTDGVGTKALIAAALGRYDTIGFDLVAMCADDLVCTGAEPLTFVDYIAVGKLSPTMVEDLVSGIADACAVVGAALIGGEMAEHPGQMPDGHFDLAGFCTGVVDRDRALPQRVEAGNTLVGIASPNLRSNGYSLARNVLLDQAGLALSDPAWDGSSRTVGEVLLEPSVLYSPAVLAACRELDVRAAAHITGGGFPNKLGRVIPAGAVAVVERSSWEAPRIFAEMARIGDISQAEMTKVFNLGIGMVLVVPDDEAGRAIAIAQEHGHRAMPIGTIVADDRADRVMLV